jgi:hypothetical protein
MNARERQVRYDKYQRYKREGRCINCGRHERSNGLKCSICNEVARLASLRSARRLRDAAFEAYGGPICICCGETERMFLTLDHVNNDGAEHRRQIQSGNESKNLYTWLKKHGYPSGFQVMCQNCNTGKFRNGGICPHQTTERIADSEDRIETRNGRLQFGAS